MNLFLDEERGSRVTKTVGLFVRSTGYGGEGGTHCWPWGVGGSGGRSDRICIPPGLSAIDNQDSPPIIGA
jgi:hypothetical protein